LRWIGSSLRLDPAGTADTADDLAAFLPPSSAIARELPWQAYLLRIAAGDQAALSALFDETSPLVFTVALRILGFRADAEEVVVDVYSQVWRTAAKYDANRGPSPDLARRACPHSRFRLPPIAARANLYGRLRTPNPYRA
jgi:Sigma-70 region 2